MAPAPRSALCSANFNQDFSCIAIGTRTGYAIVQCEPFTRVFAQADAPTAQVEMLFSTSLVTVVPLPDAPTHTSSAQRLQVINTKRQSTICELSFPTPVLQVHMNRRRLVVVLHGALFVYDISNMKLLHTVETAPNATGLCALSPNSEQCYMAYAGPLAGTTDGAARANTGSGTGTGTGTVILYDLLTLSVAGVVAAHHSPVACLAFNASGTLLATASEKGTVVRVFSVPDGAPLYQFRRGSYAAHISSITFNAASTLLCVTSDTGTVHLFQLTPTPTHDTDASTSTVQPSPRRGASLRNVWRRPSALVGSVGGYLPPSLAGMWEPARDFAHIKLPNPGVRAIAAVSKYVVSLTHSLPAQVMVLTMDGHFYVYALDLERGGECVLTKRTPLSHSHTEYSLLDGITA
ncbi:autophagy protein [Malassezia brasiliensis]|uniref:Autophagy protein n=1 Tax=Malassezia brasiliensis TaxID=1821822 RepID=A0AAF0DV14_9BASI|nr:autophagy protein [Malassezia brasiliensis]